MLAAARVEACLPQRYAGVEGCMRTLAGFELVMRHNAPLLSRC